jgi:hypothetical protein
METERVEQRQQRIDDGVHGRAALAHMERRAWVHLGRHGSQRVAAVQLVGKRVKQVHQIVIELE